jgi:DNA-binding IclR family transcriptional regulator
MTNGTDSKTLKTTATSIEVLRLVEEMGGAGVSELADRLDAPKSTVHGHLATLRSEGFLEKRGDVYYLGPELLSLGNQVRTRREEYDVASRFVDRLFEETGLDATFVTEMRGRAVCLHTTTDNNVGFDHERVGDRRYLHNTAFGKAILAELPHERVQSALDQWGLPQETEATITDREALFSELDEIRDCGYAVNRGENMEGLYALGATATDSADRVIGAFSVTGPRHAVFGSDQKDEHVQTLREVIDEYELELSISRDLS